MNILEFMDHKDLTPGSFEGESWKPWRAVLSGAFALPMSDDVADLFGQLSGGRTAPAEPVRELFVVAGRRSAKTHVSAAIAVYVATIGAELMGLTARLSPGERGVISILAVDRNQSKVALGYIDGLLESSPVLNSLVQKRNAESVDLTNNVSIEVATNSYKSVRGRTLLMALMDECAFYKDSESASPDTELYRALVPGLATTGGMLVGISSPYAKRGLLYEKHKKHYGQNTDVLVVQGATQTFNPTLDPRIIEEAEADDPAAARSEWYGLFRSEISSFVTPEIVDGCTVPGRYELPPAEGVRYTAFTDPAGGSGKDAMTLAIAHREDAAVVIDALRVVKPPFSPEQTVQDFAALLKQYRCSSVTGDRFGGEYPRELFRKHGIQYDLSDRPCSDIYRDALPMLNSGRVELLEHKQLRAELINLERRTSRNGKDSISHPNGMHDDAANACMGSVISIRKDPSASIMQLNTM